MAVMLLLVLILLLTGCEPPREHAPEPLRLRAGEVLGGVETEGFRRADEPRSFSFPRDHGLHEGFRNEWWYFTGNLRDAQGRRFGYQVTFFSAALVPPMQGPPTADGEVEAGPGASAWYSSRIWMAHAALTDVRAGDHNARERFSRENPGLAGARGTPFRVWLENWQVAAGDEAFPWELTIDTPDFALHLTLAPQKGPVLQGIEGLSQKSAEPGNASYYYSYTRLATEGEIRLKGERLQVSGESWLDREWSTSALAPEQSGWDWFSLQFEDGRELMYYQLRDQQGQAHPNSQGNWTDQAGRQTPVQAQDVQLQELEHWTSPRGTTYTTVWRLDYGDRSWLIRALLEEQWMDLSVEYWEGAVDVFEVDSGDRVGQGFLEMVRE